tara:strand:+ start:534 stop:770 length:237 start_codon:yes stop_codon:yes gene_type:complete
MQRTTERPDGIEGIELTIQKLRAALVKTQTWAEEIEMDEFLDSPFTNLTKEAKVAFWVGHVQGIENALVILEEAADGS